MRIKSWITFIFLLYNFISSEGTTDKTFNNLALTTHNKYRKLHSVAPLKLDKELVLKANDAVKKAAKDKGFGEVNAGENVYQLCATFKAELTAKPVVKAW